jgi:hypothetical protein
VTCVILCVIRGSLILIADRTLTHKVAVKAGGTVPSGTPRLCECPTLFVSKHHWPTVCYWYHSGSHSFPG